jgi:glycosyltransferase involved in cell wall biosynthesis
MMRPARLIFAGTRYDFDRELAQGLELLELSGFRLIWHLLRTPYRVVEVAEPAIVERWPGRVAQIAAVRIRSLVSRRRTRVVTYCIGYADPAEEVATRWHLPPLLARSVTRFWMRLLVTLIDRMSFGTAGAQQVYASYVGAERLRGAKVFEALPAPCSCIERSHGEGARGGVAFVGAVVERKGIRQLLAGWEARRDDGTALTLVGKGELVDEVESWATDRPEVTVVVDPPRDQIHDTLRRSSVLVLLSQRSGFWREQIGLPILEGLSHGCEVVATTETGLATWLERHGHQVVDPAASPVEIAAAIDRALAKAPTRNGSFDVLPHDDQRIIADHWMMD